MIYIFESEIAADPVRLYVEFPDCNGLSPTNTAKEACKGTCFVHNQDSRDTSDINMNHPDDSIDASYDPLLWVLEKCLLKLILSLFKRDQ